MTINISDSTKISSTIILFLLHGELYGHGLLLGLWHWSYRIRCYYYFYSYSNAFLNATLLKSTQVSMILMALKGDSGHIKGKYEECYKGKLDFIQAFPRSKKLFRQFRLFVHSSISLSHFRCFVGRSNQHQANKQPNVKR